MNEPDFPVVSVIDDDGKEHIFEELDRIETDKGKYVALLPLAENPQEENEEEDELILLKVIEKKGESYLEPIEDDDEFEEVGQAFEERLSEIFDIKDED